MPENPAPVLLRDERLASLDAFRGAIMLLMASGGLGLPQIAKESFSDNRLWNFVAYQCEHVEWAGCALWDLIQPSFMFMVGVAVPFSLARRRQQDASALRLFGRAVTRAIVLVLLAVFLTSASSDRTEWIFPNVLAQIGFGYPIVFLLAFTRPRTQWIAAGLVLIANWYFFVQHPLPSADFPWARVGVPDNWPHLTGLAAHWDKNSNAAAAFDVWFLNLFPRSQPFEFNAGGYTTLNFVPSLATMIFGLLAGQWLREDGSYPRKLRGLCLMGIVGILVGTVVHLMGLCPIVKRIWTPSWAIFSGGCVSLLLAAFVALVDWRGWRRTAFPLVVAGMNPITLYCLWQLSAGFIRRSLQTHLGPDVFSLLGSTYIPFMERASVLLVLWFALLWMYRQRIFVRI